MARQNYSFEKRQKDLAKQKKRQEKLQRRTTAKEIPPESGAPVPADAPGNEPDIPNTE